MIHTTTPARRWGSLGVAIAAMGLVWLVVLPRIGEQPRVAEHIVTQQRLGIDPSALFYSELEIAAGIAHHVERLHDTHSGKFWNASRRTVSDK